MISTLLHLNFVWFTHFWLLHFCFILLYFCGVLFWLFWPSTRSLCWFCYGFCVCFVLATLDLTLFVCLLLLFLCVYLINYCFFVLFKLRFFALESGVLQKFFARSISPPIKSFVDSPFPFTSNTFYAVYSPPIKHFLCSPFSLPPNYFLCGSCPIPPIFFVWYVSPPLS